MDSRTVTEILRIAEDIDSHGFPQLEQEMKRSLVIGKMFYGASPRDGPICDLAAARLGMCPVDLSWTDVDFSDSDALLDEVRMNSKAADLLITAFSSHETFSDGRRLTKKFPEASTVPVISLHDDFYDWQSALSHLFGFKKQLGDLRGKQVVINWAFGSTFSSPAVAHGLMISSAFLGANVRVVAPPEFSLLNRVRRKAAENASEAGSTFEESSSFADAFGNADAVFSLNWFRLDDFNHPERNSQFASKYKDWYITQENIPEQCIISTDPPLQADVTVSSELVRNRRNTIDSWLDWRVHVLAATITYVLRMSKDEKMVSVV
jgi:ornithine carbamoyltransferase